MTMPGFATELENNEGSMSKNYYYIDIKTNYPIRMIGESFATDNPERKIFIDQMYYDIKLNLKIDENVQFNTSSESIKGFANKVMKPE